MRKSRQEVRQQPVNQIREAVKVRYKEAKKSKKSQSKKEDKEEQVSVS